MEEVEHNKQDHKSEQFKKEVQVALMDLIRIEEVEVLINGEWLTGQDVLKYRPEYIMKNYFRKNCRDCEKCHIKFNGIKCHREQ